LTGAFCRDYGGDADGYDQWPTQESGLERTRTASLGQSEAMGTVTRSPANDGQLISVEFAAAAPMTIRNKKNCHRGYINTLRAIRCSTKQFKIRRFYDKTIIQKYSVESGSGAG